MIIIAQLKKVSIPSGNKFKHNKTVRITLFPSEDDVDKDSTEEHVLQIIKYKYGHLAIINKKSKINLFKL